MKIYRYTRLAFSDGLIMLQSTDLELFLSSMNGEIKKMFPNANLSTELYVGKKVYGVRWTNLAGRAYALSYWILEHLCHQGWQPFQQNGGDIFLRQEEQIQ